jgi:heat shock protein HslJ
MTFSIDSVAFGVGFGECGEYNALQEMQCSDKQAFWLQAAPAVVINRGMHNLRFQKIISTTILSLFISILMTACATRTGELDSTAMDELQNLPGTTWWVEGIAGRGVVDMSHTTIQFTKDGRAAGSTGCNNYFGSVEIDDSNITFGPLAGTRKMCPDALMDQETRFFEAMAGVGQWQIDSTGLLYLRDADGTELIRASKTETL